VADGGGLENRYGVTPIVGSNPTPSACGRPAGQQSRGLNATRVIISSDRELPVLTADLRPIWHANGTVTLCLVVFE
jgi:hypothetical protein